MSRSPARVTLRQLCRLGLPAQLLLPSLLPVVRKLAPASHAAFFFSDAQGRIVNLYAERMLPPDVMATYHERYDLQHFRRRFLQRVSATSPTSRHSVTAAEQLEPYYRDVLQPLGIGHFLYAIVRHQGRVVGQLSLYRGMVDAAFTLQDEQALAEVLHYLGEALAVPTPTPGRSMHNHTVEEALAVFDAHGDVLYTDANWQRVIRLALANTIAPGAARTEAESIPRFVHAVLATLASAPNTIHRIQSAWGEFGFRRHPLEAVGGGAAVALIASRLAVEPVQLATGAAALGLSPQQREVAVLIAQGHSNQAIAELMGVTVNTANYHVKQVFAHLDVHERSAVAQALTQANER